MRTILTTAAILGLLTLLGCGAYTNAPEEVAANGAAPAQPSNEPSNPAPEDPAPEDPATDDPAPDESFETVDATADTVGTKGKDYGGGIITEPIRQNFRAQDRLKLGVVEHALQLYQATNGRYPRSHEEFMREVVQANQIKLPELPPGHEYVYDVPSHTLKVKRPAN